MDDLLDLLKMVPDPSIMVFVYLGKNRKKKLGWRKRRNLKQKSKGKILSSRTS